VKTVQLGSISVMTEAWIPYGAGCLQAAAKADGLGRFYSFRPIIYRQVPNELLVEQLYGVDILGLTCFVWNMAENVALTKAFKKVNPAGIVIWGGANIPSRETFAEDVFFVDHPEVDYFVLGQGERPFCEILRSLAVGEDRELEQVVSRKNGVLEFPKQINDNLHVEAARQAISPYLSGEFNHIYSLESDIMAIYETNRGCPFRCAFCDWGGATNSKVAYLSIDLVFQTLESIFANPRIGRLILADANFGLREADLLTVRHMVSLKEKYGRSPAISLGGFVKNGSPFLLEILRVIHNELSINQKNLKISFQTHTKSVLNIVGRSNIDNERLVSILRPLQAEGIQLTSEMIIGLPGETAKSWLESIVRDHTLGLGYMRTYILQLVPNTAMATKEYQRNHGIKVKRIRFSQSLSRKSHSDLFQLRDCKQISEETGSKFLPTEDYSIIYQCNSFDLAELLEMHAYQWAYHTFINSNALVVPLEILKIEGVTIGDFLSHIVSSARELTMISRLLNRNQEVVRTIYGAEDETYIADPETYLFFTRDLRGHDVFELYFYADLIQAELSQIFLEILPNFDWMRILEIGGRVAKAELGDCSRKQLVNRLYGMDARLVSSQGLARWRNEIVQQDLASFKNSGLQPELICR
jgi:radical SAM superfamily enzyme YgiQ (UPF0313 family)